ncbi:MAG: PepSY domain-containing protein [Clostridia bacterium]|nr:PepSY domain-containing protein [Clostridia bacterium]
MKKRFFVLPALGLVLLLCLGIIAGLGNGSIGAAANPTEWADGSPYRTAAPTGATEPPAESVVSTPAAEYIGWERAKEIVLADLGVKETDIRDADCELERGRYEIDFDHGGYEYEYLVDALTGEILHREREFDR